MTSWAPEEDDILRRNVREFSFTKIASILPGRSRNACISRAHRLGLMEPACVRPPEPKPQRSRRHPISVSKITRAAKPAAQTLAPRTTPKPASDAPPPPVDAGVIATLKGWPKPMTSTAVLIWGLNAQTCRMPLFGDDTPHTEKFYCGALPAEGSSYCPSCRALTRPQGVAA